MRLLKRTLDNHPVLIPIGIIGAYLIVMIGAGLKSHTWFITGHPIWGSLGIIVIALTGLGLILAFAFLIQVAEKSFPYDDRPNSTPQD